MVLHPCVRRPGDADTVYVTNLQMWKSTDGGTSFTEITTPHGDNHDLWIDPANPNRMIQGNDGGACVSFNGGVTWSSIYNQPTAQFYRIDTDSRYPYRVYGTQQDNTSIAVPSATYWGAITLGDCYYPGTGESGFIAVHPDDPNIVYCRRDRFQPGRRRRAAALRLPHRADPAGQCLARGIDRHRATRHEIPLRLDLSDRVLAARQQCALCRRQPCVPHQRRRHELGGDLARSQPERHVAPGRTRAATSRAKAPAPRYTRPAPASSNRRIARARSGPRPTMAWCT